MKVKKKLKEKVRKKSVKKLEKKTGSKPSDKARSNSRNKSDRKISISRELKELSKEIWPSERDVLMRPDRYRYVRKLVRSKGCVFCDYAAKEESFDTLTVVKSEHGMVVLNKYPYNNGHLLIIPLRHCAELWHLSQEEYQDLMSLLRKAMRVLQNVYECEGMNIGMNHGAVAGAGIPDHLHWHIIPRWFGDVNFFPLVAETKVVVESLENSYHRIKDAWRKEI